MRSALLAAGVAVGLFGSAWAADNTSPPPPTPPVVDLSGLPASADIQSTHADGETHPVRARLLLDQTAVAPGDEAQIGLLLTQMEGWHTYWKSPGDIGQPTEITWSLPDSVQIDPHQYPIPQRFEEKGQISFGYEDQVLLISTLRVDPEAKAGEVELKATASWLVCKSSCIPGEATLSIPLTIDGDGEDTPYTPLFNHYTKQHPTDLLSVQNLAAEHAFSVEAVQANQPFRVAFRWTATEGATLNVPEGDALWPTFTPIAYSYDWMANSTTRVATDDGSVLVVIEGETFEPDPLPTQDQIGGLLQVEVDGVWVRTELTVPLTWAAADATPATSTSPLWSLVDGTETPETPAEPAQAEAESSLLLTLFWAFLGGLLLNIMPCVLPVLTLKLYSLIEQTDITAAEQRTAGVGYTTGILFSFWVLAAAVIVLRSAFGLEVDWGFQFQYPPYVAGLAVLVFAFGLSLMGVFEIPALGANTAANASSKEGVAGYFFTGMFATLLATPCSAPFLGTAVAVAFSAPTPVLFAVFTMVGVGLAFPFLIIAFVPGLYRFLPRPGAWMEGFKQLLGFTLIATTVWLAGVLASQIGTPNTIRFHYFLVFVALGCWIFGRMVGGGTTLKRLLLALSLGIGVPALAGYAILDLAMAPPEQCDDGSLDENLAFEESIPWQPFSEERVSALAGQTVFIDFTAEWCLTCKANEAGILETQTVRQAMAEMEVVPLKADWTRRDPVITEWMRRFKKAGVPFYVILPANTEAEPIVLPEVITTDSVVTALTTAVSL